MWNGFLERNVKVVIILLLTVSFLWNYIDDALVKKPVKICHLGQCSFKKNLTICINPINPYYNFYYLEDYLLLKDIAIVRGFGDPYIKFSLENTKNGEKILFEKLQKGTSFPYKDIHIKVEDIYSVRDCAILRIEKKCSVFSLDKLRDVLGFLLNLI